MHDLLSMMARHGYGLTFGLLLAEAFGLPFPAAIALVAAGAAVASHTLTGPAVMLAAMTALLLGDSAQFWLGHYTGWALLGFLCRVSVNPETCILRSAESFYKRGKMTIVIAKFIPGHQYDGCSTGGQHEDAVRPVSAIGFCRRGSVLHDLFPARVSFA